MLWDPFLYCINDSIQGNSETGNKVFVLPSKVAINRKRIGIQGLSSGVLDKLLVPFPTVEEQNSIVDTLEVLLPYGDRIV